MPEAALAAWPITVQEIAEISIGLINETYRVRAKEGSFALQKVHPIFGPDVLHDIRSVTEHLSKKSFLTPSLVRTTSGAWSVTAEEAGFFRLMTWVEGECFENLISKSQAEAAGALLGRFHAALVDFEVPFRHQRNIHDIHLHRKGLEAVLHSHNHHRLYADTKELAQTALSELATVPEPSGPDRVVHGDPKISNLLFSPSGAGITLVDLDTLARLPLAFELGDAMRSWCNPHKEDAEEAAFDLDMFEHALRGYLSEASFVTSEERKDFVNGIRLITLELTLRFLKDALEERYFGWDSNRFETAGDHNLSRAKNQLTMALDVARKSEKAQAIVGALPG